MGPSIEATRGIVFDTEGRVLMLRRSEGAGKGNWSLPGGKVDRHLGEGIMLAAVCEAAEEVTHAEFAAQSIEATLEYVEFEKQRIITEHYVHLDLLSNEIELNFNPNEGHDGIAFFHLSSLPENLSPHHREVLEGMANQAADLQQAA